jgi:site-specific recombinase XerD
MDVMTDAIVHYRRYLKRRNYSPHTVRNYMNTLKHFVLWLDEPIEKVTHKKIAHYIDFLLRKGLKPKTINSHLDSIRGFYCHLQDEEGVAISNPVKRGYALRLPRPLPRHLRDEQVPHLFGEIRRPRDRALFLVMLRCGLRVEEVANLTVGALDLKGLRIFVHHGKGGKDRVVYMSNDVYLALIQYLRVRFSERARKLFLVEKGSCKGKPISVRGIQKRMEYYARKSNLKVSCHHLRHTMATQLLNADADLVTIQDLLGHSRIRTTQRYCTVSNIKVQRDYFKAMDVIMQERGGERVMT